MTIDECKTIDELGDLLKCRWLGATWNSVLKHTPYNAQFSLKKYDLMIKEQLAEEAKNESVQSE